MFIHFWDMEASGDLGESSFNEAVRIQIEIQTREERVRRKGETEYRNAFTTFACQGRGREKAQVVRDV